MRCIGNPDGCAPVFRDGSLRHGHPASQRHPGRTPRPYKTISLRLSRGYPNRTYAEGHRSFCSGDASIASPWSASSRHHAGLRASPLWVARSSSFPLVRDGADSNVSALLADPEGGRMALFTVRPETRWPHDRVRLMTLATTLERDSRTVKQVMIPVHGATRNGAPRRPLPIPRPQTRRDRRPAGPRPRGVACSNAGHAKPPSRRGVRPHLRSHAATRHRLRHSRSSGSDATNCSCNHARFRRHSVMTACDGMNQLRNAGRRSSRETYPAFGSRTHTLGESSPTALTTEKAGCPDH